MELNQLRTFFMVATLRSFSKAAAELHLTQPAVTLQIKHLETEFGQLLLERYGRSLALTPAGEMFLTYVQQILNLTEQALENVGQYSTIRGRITIAAGTTNTIFRLPGILQEYRRRYPQVEIRIRNGDSEMITKLVHEKAVDLGLVTTIGNSADKLKTVPLFEDRIWLIAPYDYPPQITIGELETESLILFRTGSGFRRFLEEQFRLNNFLPKVVMEMESIEAIIRLVYSGLGLAFLPEIAVKEELAGGRLRRVQVEGWNRMSRRSYLIYRQHKYLSWPVQAFLEQMTKN
ncbi:MAG: LysR substrate-binding domain-containing protein [Bacillota bacterium]